MMDHRCGECPACLSDMAELVPCQRTVPFRGGRDDGLAQRTPVKDASHECT